MELSSQITGTENLDQLDRPSTPASAELKKGWQPLCCTEFQRQCLRGEAIASSELEWRTSL